MKRLVLFGGVALGLVTACIFAHFALIELGSEVVVLRTRADDGSWLESRLWLVDDGGVSWLHGADSHWVRNLKARPEVEIERNGVMRRYRAQVVPGPHPRVHELMRAKYGIADRWVRFVGPDGEKTVPIRVELIEPGDGSEGGRSR